MKSLISAACFLLALPLAAQQVTTADYARAESMLTASTSPLLDHATGSPVWKDGALLYRETTAGKSTSYKVDPATGAAVEVPFGRERNTARTRPGDPYTSPDGKTTLFIRDWNLWARDIASNKEWQLTHDGVKDYGYATDNAGWKHTDKPVIVWSPDSRLIATFQQDQRKTGEMYLVNTQVGHPKLDAWKYPLPGDKDVTMIERVVIDAATGAVTRLKMAPDQHRSTICDDVQCGKSGWDDVEWSPDSKQLAFVSTSRDHKDEKLRVADAATGAVREVMGETVKTYYESGQDKVNWHYLFKTNEVLWYSERDDWGQLYLYDGMTGKLKHAITHGEGTVNQVLRVDEDARTIFFLATGKEKGRQPYYSHLYSVGFDGKNQKLLTPEDADHKVSLSPDGRYFADSFSTVLEPPTLVLRNADGTLVKQLAQTSTDRLKAAGWVPPMPITTVARDGKTTLYGLLYKPSRFDATKKYPIVTHIYPGPQIGSIRSFDFEAARGDAQALAELGFIVLELDGMGTPFRSKSFHDTWFGHAGDNTLPDQVAALKQLAAKYPWIDATRAGMYGHSGGGNATADAMFHYPEIYKVGIAESGNHDSRGYEDDWDEKYVGLLDGHNYDDQANQDFAKNLQGHLLLMHGTMDDNVPPYLTLLVVDALIKANKDFDLLMIPNAHHGYGAATAYAMRRRWDYFVRYLLNTEPPKEYPVKPLGPPR